MRLTRPWRILLWALVLPASGIALFVRPVPRGSIGVLQNRIGRSNPQILATGMQWRIPLWEWVGVYSKQPTAVSGETSVKSRDGIDVRVPFSFQVALDEEIVLRAHRQSEGRPAMEWIRGQGEKAIQAASQRMAAYQLLRESLPSQTEASLQNLLSHWGMVSGTLKVGPGTVKPEVLEQFSTGRLAAMRRPTGAKVVVIGLDGADWDFVLPLIQRGELPNLAKLRREGAYGKIRTNNPPLSPLLWTTVATGKSPDIHGINDFLVVNPKTGGMEPISSDFRKVKALWNISSDAGLTSEFVAWWATWPAESIRGIMVSDRVSYSLFGFAAGGKAIGRETFPEGYFQEVQGKLETERDVTLADLAPLVHISPEQLAATRTAEASLGRRGEDPESLATLVRVLASTQNYQRIALDLLSRKQPDLFAVYFEGIDEVNHRFAHLEPPRMPGITEERFSRYSGAVAGFYRLQDRLLGELLKSLAPESTIILLSDHGFTSGAARPKDVPPFISAQPGLWHSPYGVLILSGAHVKPGPMSTASLYDIAPTILDLLGLPPAEDLPGRSLREALDPGFEGGNTLPKIVSYEAYGDSHPTASGSVSPGAGSADSEAMLETLRSLGYVGPAPSPSPGSKSASAPNSATTALYHANLASILVAKGDLAGGEKEYRETLKADPNTVSALLGLAKIQEEKGLPDQALLLLQRVIGLRDYHDPALLIRMANLFRESGRVEDGLIYFDKIRAVKPEEPLLDTAVGVLYSALNRPDDAEKAFRRALVKDPLSLPAMEEYFVFCDQNQKLPSLIPDLEAAIRAEEGSFMHHNWLALAYRREGNLEGTEKELRRAAELGPDEVGPIANLGSLYLQENRVQEAVEILQRALSKDPKSVEVRTNLIVALGSTGNLDKARELYEEGVQWSPRYPSLSNAMAFVYQAHGHPKEAVDLLLRSLRLDPHQKQALDLLRQLDPAAAAQITP